MQNLSKVSPPCPWRQICRQYKAKAADNTGRIVKDFNMVEAQMPLLIRVDLLWIGSTACHAERRNKNIRSENSPRPSAARRPPIINSDSRHWLLTQVRSSHNVADILVPHKVRHVPSSGRELSATNRQWIRQSQNIKKSGKNALQSKTSISWLHKRILNQKAKNDKNSIN